jgi:chemotaxis protein CheD
VTVLADEKKQELARFEYFLKPGYVFISREPAMICTVLGSCVAICLWDRRHRFGGGGTFLYPAANRAAEATTSYGNISILVLLRMMLAEGADRTHLEAQIFGGGAPPQVEGGGMGAQNVRVARKILRNHGIRITSEDVGGSKGRKLVYNTETNEAVVLKVDRVRKADWYPYEE